MIIAGTGHRPHDCEPEHEVREKVRAALLEFPGATVITGMAAGFDLFLGLEAIELGHPTWAARPWAGHTSYRGQESQYARIIEAAEKVVNVDESVKYPGVWVYRNRDKWMVDHCTHVLAYLNPLATRGGTYGTVQYAKKVGKPVRNIYGDNLTALG
jgi:hypothetical protein